MKTPALVLSAFLAACAPVKATTVLSLDGRTVSNHDCEEPLRPMIFTEEGPDCSSLRRVIQSTLFPCAQRLTIQGEVSTFLMRNQTEIQLVLLPPDDGSATHTLRAEMTELPDSGYCPIVLSAELQCLP